MKLLTQYEVPLFTFSVGRFLPPQVIPFQAGTLTEQSPLSFVQGVDGELRYTISGIGYLARITTDKKNRKVRFEWFRLNGGQ